MYTFTAHRLNIFQIGTHSLVMSRTSGAVDHIHELAKLQMWMQMTNQNVVYTIECDPMSIYYNNYKQILRQRSEWQQENPHVTIHQNGEFVEQEPDNVKLQGNEYVEIADGTCIPMKHHLGSQAHRLYYVGQSKRISRVLRHFAPTDHRTDEFDPTYLELFSPVEVNRLEFVPQSIAKNHEAERANELTNVNWTGAGLQVQEYAYFG